RSSRSWTPSSAGSMAPVGSNRSFAAADSFAAVKFNPLSVGAGDGESAVGSPVGALVPSVAGGGSSGAASAPAPPGWVPTYAPPTKPTISAVMRLAARAPPEAPLDLPLIHPRAPGGRANRWPATQPCDQL